jgi:hypothetical protein
LQSSALTSIVLIQDVTTSQFVFGLWPPRSCVHCITPILRPIPYHPSVYTADLPHEFSLFYHANVE